MRVFNWKVYKRRKSWIFDILKVQGGKVVYCKCFCLRHLRVWNEGDRFIKYGGKACEECIKKARDEYLSNPTSKR